MMNGIFYHHEFAKKIASRTYRTPEFETFTQLFLFCVTIACAHNTSRKKYLISTQMKRMEWTSMVTSGKRRNTRVWCVHTVIRHFTLVAIEVYSIGFMWVLCVLSVEIAYWLKAISGKYFVYRGVVHETIDVIQ